MTRLLLLAQFLATFAVSAWGSSYKYVYPTDCDFKIPSSCDYTVTCENTKGGVSFMINATLPENLKNSRKPWIGIGISKENNKNEMHYMIGGFVKKKRVFRNGYSVNGNELIQLSTKMTVRLTRKKDHLTMYCIRPIIPKDKRDLTFKDSDCYYFYFLTDSGEFQDKKGTFDPKSANQGIFSETRICIGDLSNQALTSTEMMKTASLPLESVTGTPLPLEPGDDHDVEVNQQWKYPHDCKDANCTYIASWSIDKINDGVNFRIETYLRVRQKYTGIMFSKDGNLTNLYAILVLKEDNGGLSFRHGRMKDLKSIPVEFASDSLLKSETHISGDHLIISATHRREPSDPADLSFHNEDCYYFVFLYDGGNLTKNNKIMEPHKYYITKSCIHVKEESKVTTVSNIATKISSRSSTKSNVTAVWNVVTSVTKIASGTSSSPKIICNYHNQDQNRPKIAKFMPDDVNPIYCTHIIFCFATVEDNQLATTMTNDDSVAGKKGLYERINDLKKKNSGLKTLLAVGGEDVDPKLIKNMLRTKENRDLFVRTCIVFLRERNFDGLALMFLFLGKKGSSPQYKEQFTLFIKELRAAFRKESHSTGKDQLKLTVYLPAVEDVVDHGYNISAISPELNFINVMSYDFHHPWESQTAHHAPLFPSTPTDQLDVRSVLYFLVTHGVPKEKLVMGLPFHGVGYTLINSEINGLGAAAKGPSLPGEYTQRPGYMAYFEVCKKLKDSGANRVFDKNQKVPYLVTGDQWIGYTDTESMREAGLFCKNGEYGGVMVSNIADDDFGGKVCKEGQYPLTRTLSETLLGQKVTLKTTLQDILLSESTTPISREISLTTSGSRETSLKSSGSRGTLSTTLEFKSVSSTTIRSGTTRKDQCDGKSDGERYEDTKNCSNYFECHGGISVKNSCPQTQFYNPQKSICTNARDLERIRRIRCGIKVD